MHLRRKVQPLLFLMSLLLLLSRATPAQTDEATSRQPASALEMLSKAEEDLIFAGARDAGSIDPAKRAERQLKEILKYYPDTFLRDRIKVDLDQAQEIIASHDLQVAEFYLHQTQYQAAAARLLTIVSAYPHFTMMDEVLFRLAVISLKIDSPEKATNYFWKLICRYPTSTHVNYSFEELNRIGVNAWEGCDRFQ